MRLTKSTGHAIRILIDCARAGDSLIKVAELSERLQITPQNVFKIVNLLARAGLIEAMRGRNGGVRLARPAHLLRISDVVRATEVTRVAIEEGGASGQRSRGHGVNQVFDDALEAFIEVLDRHTIADMLKSQSSRKPSAARLSGTTATTRRKPGPAQRVPGPRGRRARRPLHDNS
jgi:Rrf2 family protein